MRKLPIARSANILVSSLDKELLIYDLPMHKAYSLNETSAAVYQACDGQTSFDELKAKSNLTDEIIYLALDELKKENLFEKSEEYNSPFAGMSRREAIRKVGLASMIALPVISSLIAPTAAMAASVSCTTGTPNAQGTCPNGQRCVSGACTPCITNGQAVPGGCSVSTFSICCSNNCLTTTNTCMPPPA